MEPSGAPREPGEGRLPLPALLVYASPAAGVGFMVFLANMYLMKFSTDVLLIPPAAMGVIYMVSRVWDALSDPLAGYLSDRTQTRWGRRRPWLLAAALPVAVIYVLMWSPPRGLETGALTVWMALAVLLFYTGFTVFEVPHTSLGAELSTSYRDRNRIFGVRRICFGAGTLLAVAGMGAMSAAPDAAAARLAALWVAIGAGAITAALMLFTGARLRERPDYMGRGSRRASAALRDVLQNPHARLLLLVFSTQQVGVAAVTIMAPYYTQYILGSAESVWIVLGSFMVCSIAAVPLWVRAGRRFEKKTLLLASMGAVSVCIAALAFCGEAQVALAGALAGFAGAVGAGADVLFPSVQADVIDYDEYRTGERKEGAYFAGWAFAGKSAAALAGVIVGLVLQASGFRPNAQQPPAARLAILLLISGLPFLFYGGGLLLFLRFSLDARAHGEIRAAIDARR